jgi:hypothetical protein
MVLKSIPLANVNKRLLQVMQQAVQDKTQFLMAPAPGTGVVAYVVVVPEDFSNNFLEMLHGFFDGVEVVNNADINGTATIEGETS